jgi:hypothetical protein
VRWQNQSATPAPRTDADMPRKNLTGEFAANPRKCSVLWCGRDWLVFVEVDHGVPPLGLIGALIYGLPIRPFNGSNWSGDGCPVADHHCAEHLANRNFVLSTLRGGLFACPEVEARRLGQIGMNTIGT